MSKYVNKVPTKEHPFIFQTWTVDFFILNPFEVTIDSYTFAFYIRLIHRIWKWEYARKKAWRG